MRAFIGRLALAGGDDAGGGGIGGEDICWMSIMLVGGKKWYMAGRNTVSRYSEYSEGEPGSICPDFPAARYSSIIWRKVWTAPGKADASTEKQLAVRSKSTVGSICRKQQS